jgi:hypothetical protein
VFNPALGGTLPTGEARLAFTMPFRRYTFSFCMQLNATGEGLKYTTRRGDEQMSGVIVIDLHSQKRKGKTVYEIVKPPTKPVILTKKESNPHLSDLIICADNADAILLWFLKCAKHDYTVKNIDLKDKKIYVVGGTYTRLRLTKTQPAPPDSHIQNFQQSKKIGTLLGASLKLPKSVGGIDLSEIGAFFKPLDPTTYIEKVLKGDRYFVALSVDNKTSIKIDKFYETPFAKLTRSYVKNQTAASLIMEGTEEIEFWDIVHKMKKKMRNGLWG